ncbi:GNAT family N-acetyltransferase [soil metagenome]
MNLTLRALSTDDIPELARHLAAVEVADDTGEHYSEADLVEEFANPDIEVGKDIVGAFEGDQIVGYFAIYPRSTDGVLQKVHLEGSVRPDRRGEGLGTQLVEAMLARAEEVHAEKHPDLPAQLSLTGLSHNIAQRDLLASVGMVAQRWNFVMRIRLGLVPPSAEPPVKLAGELELQRFEESFSAAMLEAHNQAFLDHPNFTPWTEVMWKQWVTGSRNYRPELSFVVVDPSEPERVVAYLQTNEFDAYFEATGRREAYVAKLGTVGDYRGRGLAGALLAHALSAYQRAGFDEASLDVDSENPTGALGIYERAGFAVESRWSSYALTRKPLH